VNRRAAVIALGVVAVALIAWFGYRSVRAPTPGPLAHDIAESLGIQRRVGEVFTFLQTRIAGAERKYFYFASGKRPDRTKWTDVHPVFGFVVEPETVKGWERGAELLFCVTKGRRMPNKRCNNPPGLES
jgi:hypothetical protein